MLLLAAIIAVPMFLEREPPPLPDNLDVRIPPIEGTKFTPGTAATTAVDAKKSVDVPAAITEPTGAQVGAVVGGAAVVGAAAVAAGVAPKATEKTVAAPSAAVKVIPAPTKTAEKTAEKSAAKKIEAAPAVRPRKPGQLTIQILAVRDAASAKTAYDRARSLKFPVYNDKREVANGVVHRVRVGPYDTPAQAEKARARLAQAGFDAKVITLQ